MGSLNPALKQFWQTKADIKILKGGRASSKTWDIAGFSIFLAINYNVKFLCVRSFQNKIQESVYATLIVQIDNFNLRDQFDILKSTIVHKKTGSSFHFYGLSRNTEEVKGFVGANILWVEEAAFLTQDQWSIIEPTIREQGSECWVSYNPRLVADFIETSSSFKHDPENGVIVRHINYQENPFLSDTMLRKINRLKDSDYEEYEHVYLGIPRSDDDRVVIKRSWIEASIDAHIKLGIDPKGKKVGGFDVADDGTDLNAQIHRHGILAFWGEHWKAGEDELLKSCKRVYAKSLELGSHVNYDSIGVGASAGAKFNEMNDERTEQSLSETISYAKFNAGSGVLDPDDIYIETESESITNKDFFANRKAQEWWNVARLFMNTYNAITKGEPFNEGEIISISSEMPNLANLITELSTPRRDFDNTGRVKVESKKDLKKREVKSPNDADAFIMAYAKTETNSMNELLKISLGQ